MGFGYLLLAVKSEQDNYLIGNPQFTFFKAVYKKHTNFAIDYQFLDFTGETENAFGKKLYIDIPKNGDLLHRMYLTFDINFPTLADQKNAAPLIYNLIDYIDLYIGGQLVDRHYSSWLAIWDELIEKENVGLANMTGIRNQMTTSGGTNTYTVPLRFWFNNNIGLALPLIALQYNDVKLEVRIKDKSYIDAYARGDDDTGTPFPWPGASPAPSNLSIKRIRLINELIHLDKDERRLFSTNNHEYLITQVQTNLNSNIQNYTDLYNSASSKENFEQIEHKLELRFTYPVKQLFWSIQDIIGNYKSGKPTRYAENKGIFEYNYWNNYLLDSHQMSNCNLVINGKDLMEPLPAQFYRDIQQYQYHNSAGLQHIDNTPDTNINRHTTISAGENYFKRGSGVYTYSFALRPEDYQPSGSLNFSKLESAVLKFGLKVNPQKPVGGTNGNATNKTINVYAVNYNVLRIMSGQAGLAFVN